MQSHESWQNYLLWLAERGLAYPWPASDAPAAGGLPALPPAQVRLIALSASTLTPDEGALLGKMLAAMGLAPEQILIAQGGLPPIDQVGGSAELILALGPKAGQLLGLNAADWAAGRSKIISHPGTNLNLLLIAHPGDLLRQPTDKRQAWADLQLGMRSLGLLPLHS